LLWAVIAAWKKALTERYDWRMPKRQNRMSSLAREPKIAQEIASFDADWLPREPLSAHTSLAVGGPADLVRVHDFARLPGLMDYLRRRGVPWRILGGGSNLLVSDQGFEDLVLHLARPKNGVQFDGRRVEVAAAVNLGTTVMECAKRNLGGMEGLIGVPGTVGGALRMNAGAYGIEIGPLVRSLTIYRGATGRIEFLEIQDVRFEYRHTSFAPDDIMLSVSLELPERDYAEILERIKLFNQKRRASQPIEEKSAGCIFKNPKGFSAGKVIDELGLKGTRVGGAVISERHANFFVNRHQATARDFLTLIDMVRERVLSAYGIELEEEVILWRP
jgi:UDP-N-acetylmuramate dehydrogenase